MSNIYFTAKLKDNDLKSLKVNASAFIEEFKALFYENALWVEQVPFLEVAEETIVCSGEFSNSIALESIITLEEVEGNRKESPLGKLARQFPTLKVELIVVDYVDSTTYRLYIANGTYDLKKCPITRYMVSGSSKIVEEAFFELQKVMENQHKTTELVDYYNQVWENLQAREKIGAGVPEYIICEFPDWLGFEDLTDIWTAELEYSL